MIDHDVERRAVARRLRDAAVVDIRHVAHVGDAVAQMHEIAPQDVEEQKRPRVTEVGFRGRRETADVDPGFARAARHEGFGRARARVIESE